MNKVDYQYIELVKDILKNGVDKSDRTGTGIKSVFGRQLRFKLEDGFPLLTTKKMHLKGIITELIWFLNGDTNIKYLVDNNCNIWNNDAYNYYLRKVKIINSTPISKDEFIENIKSGSTSYNFVGYKLGDLGKVYGYQWRNQDGIDQITNLIDMLKNDPDSRRLKVNAWKASDLPEMALPCCHYGFQCYTTELTDTEKLQYISLDGKQPKRKISLMWNQRSVDVGLGFGYNLPSYSILLMMLAREVNMIPDEIICSLGDTHIYKDHIEGLNEQITREPYELPELIMVNKTIKDISEYNYNDFTLKNYKSHPKIFLPLSN